MSNKTTTNNVDRHHHHNVIIGDILVHSESKIAIIQVVIQSLANTSSSSLTLDKPIIRRLLPNSSGLTSAQTTVPCDLKNKTTVKVTYEQTKPSSPSKKIMRIQKAGLALVKELKSKVVTSNNNGSKILPVNTDTESEQTYF